ncbi:hypothetical protein ATANTOWER_002628 [Ataeniobius toweri]|uniref:Uncharacterized protein n=1 Tax=Ataeniobius toweri TaxID=208326 RepID=A0ABU7CI60_9TELE|nr:hypothetical protein [Ataeniobius toweri]
MKSHETIKILLQLLRRHVSGCRQEAAEVQKGRVAESQTSGASSRGFGRGSGMGSEAALRSLDLLLDLFLVAALSFNNQSLVDTQGVQISDTTGFGVKEHSQIVAQHNSLHSRVIPMAANMQKMVIGTCCLSPLSVLNVAFAVS